MKGRILCYIGVLLCVSSALAMSAPVPTQHAERLLGSRDWQTRVKGARELGYMGPAAAKSVPKLLRCLNDKDYRVRAAVAVSLGLIGAQAKEVVPALLARLKDEKSEVRAAAAMGLAGFSDPGNKVVEALLTALQDDDPMVQKSAAESIAILAPERPEAKASVPTLLRFLLDRNAPNRWRCAFALGRIAPNDENVVIALASVLTEGFDPGLAKEVNDVLEKMRDKGYDKLSEREEDLVAQVIDWYRLQCQSAWALGQFGSLAVKALPALIQALDYGYTGYKHEFKEQYKSSLNRSELLLAVLKGVLLGVMRSFSPNREIVPYLFSPQLLPPTSSPNLREVVLIATRLRTEPHIRAIAAESIARIGKDAKPAKEALIKLLDDGDDWESLTIKVDRAGNEHKAIVPAGVVRNAALALRAIGVPDKEIALQLCHSARRFLERKEDAFVMPRVELALEFDPNCALAYNLRGSVRLPIWMDMYDRAWNKPFPGPSLRELRLLWQQLPDVLGDFEMACRLEPNNADFHADLGEAILTSILWDRFVIEQAKNRYRLLPRSPVKLVREVYRPANKEEMKYSNLNLDRALQSFDRAIALDPSLASAYGNRAIVKHLMSDFDSAWSDVKKAEELGWQPPAGFIESLQEELQKQKQKHK